MHKEIIALLQSHICSQGLNESELLLIAEHATIVDYAAAELLYRAGEPVTAVVLVVHGRFRMSAPRPDGQEQFVAYLGPGRSLVCWRPGTSKAPRSTWQRKSRLRCCGLPRRTQRCWRISCRSSAGICCGWLACK